MRWVSRISHPTGTVNASYWPAPSQFSLQFGQRTINRAKIIRCTRDPNGDYNLIRVVGSGSNV